MPRQFAWGRYQWATKIAKSDAFGLSWDGQEGLEMAKDLAGYSEPRTLGEVADEYGYSATTVRRRIEQARLELFGPIGDRAIYYRLKRESEVRERPMRECGAPDCSNALPAGARSSRRFCDSSLCESNRRRRRRLGTSAA